MRYTFYVHGVHMKCAWGIRGTSPNKMQMCQTLAYLAITVFCGNPTNTHGIRTVNAQKKLHAHQKRMRNAWKKDG